MSKDIEQFLEDFLGHPVPRPKRPAAEIMWSGTVPSFQGPRLDVSRKGKKRWVTRLSQKPDLRRFTNQLPML
ncbi:MAG: hypothetical protein AMXMBFR33_62120 [Candidatus Xenobia bacterium]